MSIIKALKRRYRRKKEFKEYQKGIERKKEYGRYVNKHIESGKPAKKTMSYAQWHEHVYEKYEKSESKPKKASMKQSSTKKKETAAGLLTGYARRTGSPKGYKRSK